MPPLRETAAFLARGAAGPFLDDGLSEPELALFVGKHADRYLRSFRKFKRDDEDSFAVTWHWPAFFFSFWWMLYRKLYRWSLLVLVLGCVPYLGFLMMFVFGMTGNYIYYSHAKKKLLELKALPASDVERAAAVARAGGVNNVTIIVAPLVTLALIAILAAVAVPQFMTYRQRAFDRQAKHEIQDACRRGAAIFAEQPGKMLIEPDELLYAGLVRTPEVEMVLLDGRRESFSISAQHVKGTKKYSTNRQCILTEAPRQPDVPPAQRTMVRNKGRQGTGSRAGGDRIAQWYTR